MFSLNIKSITLSEINPVNLNNTIPKFILFLFLISLNSCVSISNKYDELPPGIWRGTLKIYDESISSEDLKINKGELLYDELPFNFNLDYTDEGKMFIEIINGEERIIIDDIIIGLDRATAKDTILINFPLYNSYIKGIHEEGTIEGHWHVKYKGEYSIPFIASHGRDYRFKVRKNNKTHNLTGKWKTNFDFDKEEPYPAIGEFKQVGDKLEGTFRTETGDYRFLEGTVQDNKFFMSVFDGSHAFLFQGLIEDDNNLVGTFKSGKHYTSNFTAVRDDKFELTDPYHLSKIIEPEKAITFSFPNTEGNIISLDDKEFDGKIKLVNILGTWCPNCRDESKFLRDYLKRKPNIEAISICFERFKDEKKSLEAIDKYTEQLELDWPFLYGGFANKAENQKVLSFMDKLISYPTLMIIDGQNKVRYVHTGFSGPATSKFESFKLEFDKIIDQLEQQNHE